MLIHTFTFIHLADAFIQSDLQLGNTSSSSSQRGKTDKESARKIKFHCSKKYKLDRERLKKRESFFFLNSDEKDEFSAIA